MNPLFWNSALYVFKETRLRGPKYYRFILGNELDRFIDKEFLVVPGYGKKCDRFFLIYLAIPSLARTRISRWRISSAYNWISISPVMWWGSVRGERHCVSLSCKGQRQQYWTDRVAVRSTQTKWSASRGDFMDPTQPPEPVPPAHLLNSYIASRSLSFVAPTQHRPIHTSALPLPQHRIDDFTSFSWQEDVKTRGDRLL